VALLVLGMWVTEAIQAKLTHFLLEVNRSQNDSAVGCNVCWQKQWVFERTHFSNL